MSDESYWFYLESFVYIVIKGNDLLMYNTITGKFLSYVDNRSLIAFILELNRKENLYVLKVSHTFLKDNRLDAFINEIRDYFMGDLIDVSLSPKKPFILPPHFDIRENIEIRERRTYLNVSADSLFSIKELTFYIDNLCENNCNVCHTACNQFLWCTVGKDKDRHILTPGDIEEIIEQVKGCPVKNINIIGGDLNRYPHLNELMNVLSHGSFNVNYYFHLSHLRKRVSDKIKVLNPRARINVLIECISQLPSDELTLLYLKELEPDGLIFLIQEKEDIVVTEQIVEYLKLENISVQSYFNGQNLDFFKKNVFIDRESLSENPLDLGAINARKFYNTMNFGKMYIMADKKIYSDINDTPLGTIGDITIEKAVIIELTKHGNWLRARRDESPCCDCLLNTICPPLSNFEIISGVYNSCNIMGNQELRVINEE